LIRRSAIADPALSTNDEGRMTAVPFAFVICLWSYAARMDARQHAGCE